MKSLHSIFVILKLYLSDRHTLDTHYHRWTLLLMDLSGLEAYIVNITALCNVYGPKLDWWLVRRFSPSGYSFYCQTSLNLQLVFYTLSWTLTNSLHFTLYWHNLYTLLTHSTTLLHYYTTTLIHYIYTVDCILLGVHSTLTTACSILHRILYTKHNTLYSKLHTPHYPSWS